MKQSLFLFLICLTTTAFAQSLTVGEVPLEEIDSDYIELQIVRFRPFEQTQYYAIFYGQRCMEQPIQLLTRAYMNSCVGLRTSDGLLVEGLHYTEALTLLNRAGWELINVSQDISDGDSSSDIDSVFLLRRKE